MTVSLQDILKRSEERYKEEVYRKFDAMRSYARDTVKSKKAYVNSGSYDDQETFMTYGELAGAVKSRHDIEALVQKLYRRPYFAHIEIREENEEINEHYYLSDCESLDQTVSIGSDGFLLPFKQDKERPISVALFHCYQDKKGEPISYQGNNETYVLLPQLICDDEIDNRKLIEAVQLFPVSEILQITADELLEEKLQENRNNPTLRNIISTLQRQQFEIIEADVEQNFVVQGCAGSGKSQCLLHRLFFLRDALSEDAWEHVLLLTPTQLFRNYSADLIRRYQLSDVSNCSISDLYQQLLNGYDDRFKNRQYVYELSEEYLPDEYLHEVYNPDTIKQIDTEILQAIHKYVSDGCTALGIDIPSHIMTKVVTELVRKLDQALQEFDEREAVLQEDMEYANKRMEYELLQKELETAQRKRTRILDDLNKIETERKLLNERLLVVNEADQERIEWHSQQQQRISSALIDLQTAKEKWDSGSDIQLPANYAQKLHMAWDILNGDQYKADEEYSQFLDEYFSQADAELKEITKKQTPEKTAERLEKRKGELTLNAQTAGDNIERLTAAIDEYVVWLRNRSTEMDGEQSRRTLRRSEMERARYFLMRIESAVFEREVWNALAPIKQKYHIQTMQNETLKEGRQKESRILYKSDLLFYLKIYAYLYPDQALPDYRLICIDEGQDLHQADYDMLHHLYPRAVFNVFGDTDQVLHIACGIHDWRKESGIRTLYSLNKNYRNTAAIVDFCNRKFNAKMEYIGKVQRNQMPHVLKEIVEFKSVSLSKDIVIIVKDRRTLEGLCAAMGKPVSAFEYLDTKAEMQNGNKIPCYSIFAAKGLEFSNVLVCARGMTLNQKVVACTRAMEELYYYE